VINRQARWKKARPSPTIRIALAKLLDMFCAIYQNLRDKSISVTKDPLAEVEHHEQIFRAIESKDAALAQQLIIGHFSGIKERLQAAQIGTPAA
jgi:DNA-binding FadR family transcriptional regulator